MASDETEKKSTVREYYEALLIAVIFVNFARIFAFQAFKIPTGSMEDNLKIGDHIIVNKFIYGPLSPPWQKLLPAREIRRGDIIVFRYPLQPDTDFVKRVIGLPGDVIEVGDNRDRSSDSRYWGTVPRSMIKGRAFMVYWSFKGNPPPPDAPPIERVKELWRVVWRFFPDTRWNRMFFIVDSKYHFTPERSPGEPGEMP